MGDSPLRRLVKRLAAYRHVQLYKQLYRSMPSRNIQTGQSPCPAAGAGFGGVTIPKTKGAKEYDMEMQ